MKLAKIWIAAAAIAFSPTSWAVPAEVGGLDTLVASADAVNFPNPDDVDNARAAELAWVNGVLGASYTDSDFIKLENATLPTITREGNLFYWDFGSYAPAYFFLKWGQGGITGGNIDHYLYVNNSSTSWGYIDMTGTPFAGAGADRISHIGIFGGSTEVPEPGTLALLGLGLIGLGAARRKSH